MLRSAIPLLVLTLAAAASAATFTVNTTIDAVDAVPGNGVCATAGGTCSLRAAVQEANALAGPDDIAVPAGTFLLTEIGPGEDAAVTGDLDVTQPLTVVGAGFPLTILDGVGQDRVFDVAAGVAFTLRAATIRNGTGSVGPGGGVAGANGAPLVIEDVAFIGNRGASGAALYANNAPLVVRGSRFENNRTTSAGGALAHSAGAAPLEIRDTVFDGNAAGTDAGALVYAGTNTVTIATSTFTRNAAARIGAAWIADASNVALTDVTVEDCSATAMGDVGGIYLDEVGSATAQALTLRRNATNGDAGGMAVVASGSITISGCTVEDNSAFGAAGGVYASAGAIEIDGCVLRGNRSITSSGGGMRIESTGNTTLRNLVVEDNHSATGGAGFVAQPNAGALTLTSSRIAGNTSTSGPGGGIYALCTGAITVQNTTVQGNQAVVNTGGAYLASGQSVTIDGSTFADNAVSGATADGGGLVIAGTSASLTNSTISGNWAQRTGSGLYTLAATTVVANTTFHGNTAGVAGAAIATTGTVTVRATAIGASDVASCAAALASDGDNVDQDGSCLLAGPRDRSGLDPMLGPLQDNGGTTFTHEPLAASPLVDGAGACPATDQRGVARPTDGDGDGTAVCDIGAVEFVDECPTDPVKRRPGVCGCGVPDIDTNENGAIDCLLNAELKARIAVARTVMQSLTGVKSAAETAAKAQLTALADGILAHCATHASTIVLSDPSAKLVKLAKKARKALRATRTGKGAALVKKRTRAGKALDALGAVVAPQ